MEPEVKSSFFSDNSNNLSEDFLDLVDNLNDCLVSFTLPPPIACAYNPTIYARTTFEMYIRKYCNSKKPIMYLGMNPGPWGMSQTGVPFGEINSVKNWLQIEGPVAKPPVEISTRPVLGFECKRTEISGQKFWGLFKSLCDTPDKFFESSFVYNYLPQQWLAKNGRNVTPEALKGKDKQQLFSICDPVLIKILELYEVKIIVAIGRFCESRAKKVLKENGYSSSIQVLYMPHPSPRTRNNGNWNEQAIIFLENNNLKQYYI